MLARILLSFTLVIGLAAATNGQDKKSDKKKSDDLNQRVLSQVKKSLKRFEKELGDKKFESILKSVENSLNGKANHFEFEMKAFDPKIIHEHLKFVDGTGKFNPKDLVPHIIHLDGGKKRRMIGVMLHGDGNGPIKVQKVMKDSAAEAAGIKSGDVIIKVNGKNVNGSKALTDAIQKSKGKVKVTVKRNKKEVVVEVQPKEVTGNGVEQALIEFDGLELPKVQIDKGASILKGIDADGKIIDIREHIIKKGDIIKKITPQGKAHGVIQVKPQGEDGKPYIIQVKPHAVDGKPHKIIEVNPTDIKKRIELRIDRAEDAKRLLRNKTQNDKKIVERRVEIKSDLSDTIEKLQKQMKELQREIESLKKSKK